ncbi:branched-chain amino acid aminotransferase, possible 4-amino-4-deoxychorismate lyase PabC [Malaciobacter marinus]|uniref:Branched-chain amino acid aminotransferase n=1 Tax=Malaciobacter marinus TaxID=505249 RepID=A0A347TNH2_9BACT|nr:aminotransferase class IV family protein [Malaciobacter marinus]AXX88150.1 branched-chain amino acid aminotransferase, possible 4-amino-4-deoxychorismate lyase PabC [Malaciobacter marinus]PHO16479.1 branched-chain amino acid aminotransferase [Malaciobacter marinus]
MNGTINYFETIKCEDYEVFNLSYHNKRIAKTIARNFDLSEYISPLNEKLLRCKVIYNSDEIIDIKYFEYKKKEIKNFKIIKNDKIEYSKKYLNRDSLNKLFEQKESCDEIMIFKNSLLTDTSIANIAIFYDNSWITPKKPLLNGTTRQRYINSGFIKEADITLAMLKNAKKIALLNAMIDFDILEDYSLFS